MSIGDIEMPKERILVLGAGTGGLVAGNLLVHHGYEVTIVEKNTIHLFQPGMLWIAFQGHNPEKYIRPVKDLVKPTVNLVQGTVKTIDLDERKVELADGRSLDYDYLIVALGSTLAYEELEGHKELVEKYGDFYSGAQNAAKFWSHFSKLKEGTLVIAAADPLYKCVPAPHKAVFLSTYTLKKKGLLGKVKVKLAVPFIYEYPNETISEILRPVFEERQIEVHTMFTVDRISLEEKKIYSLEGDELEFDLAAVIPFHKGPDIEFKQEGVIDADRFIKVDKYKLNIEGYDDAFAVGDCNNAPTSKTGVTAHLGAEVVVDQIMGYEAKFTGRTNCPVVTNGEALFVISDYDNPPVHVKLSKMKRLMEDFFIASYWSSLRDPEKWRTLFGAYFKATEPAVLKERGW